VTARRVPDEPARTGRSAGWLRPVRAVVVKELRQIVRDRRTLLTLLFVPSFFLFVFGYALNFDIRNVRLAVWDADRSSASRELISAFANSGYFDLVAMVERDADVDRLLDANRARAVLVIPPRFGADVSSQTPARVQVIVNGDNANTATTVMGYVLGLIGSFSSRLEMEARVGSRAGPLLTLEPRVWYNPELRSAVFLVPGLIAFIAMLTGVVSTSLSVVREKEAGTMEQVRMAPITPVAYIVGKTIPYFFILLVSAASIIAVAMLLFDLPMRGSWLVLLGSVSIFLVCALGFGLLISTIVDTQSAAFQVALLASLLPTVMLSGFIFPITSMPWFLQAVTHVVPARYFVVALRSVMLKGVGPGLFMFDLLALSGLAFVILALASLRLWRQWT
jgi:ABC-2 type transport system permease protein